MDHASVSLSTVARRGSYGLTRKLILLHPHPVAGLVLKVGDAEKFPWALDLEGLEFFSQSQQAGSMSRNHAHGWDFSGYNSVSEFRYLRKQ